VRQADRPVVICRVAGRHAPVVEKITVALPGEGGAAPEVLPELIEGAMVVVAERAYRLWKRLRVRHLEERIARVGCQPAEQVRTQHGRDHRAVSPTRLPGDAPMTRLRQRAIASVDP